MRNLEKHRRAGVLAVAVAAGVLCAASPAAADVTVSPPSAPQGSGTNVTFKVTNTARSPITRLKLVLPAELPVAEAYPLSVDDWAPQITTRSLDTPLTSIHGAEPVTETAADITWIAMPGKALAPGKSADLPVAMGPMPMSAQMSFTVQATYADPAKGAALPPAVLSLSPAVPGQEGAAHPGHGGTGTTTTDTDAATFAALIDANDGPGFWTIAGWVVAALAAAAGAVAVLRARRRPQAPAAEAGAEVEPEDKELVSAAKAPRVTGWSYRDSPAE